MIVNYLFDRGELIPSYRSILYRGNISSPNFVTAESCCTGGINLRRNADLNFHPEVCSLLQKSILRALLFGAATAGLLVLQSVSIKAAAFPPTVDPTYNLSPKQAVSPAPDARPTVDWIWADHTSDGQTVYIRKDQDLESIPKSVALYVNADDSAIIYINGVRLTPTTPVPQNVNSWQVTQRFEIAPLLKLGNNVLAIKGQNTSGPAGVAACIIFNGEVPLVTDSSWLVSEDVTQPDNWTASDFDDSKWSPATVIAAVGSGPWSGVGALSGWPFDSQTTVPYLSHISLPFAGVAGYEHGDGKIDDTGHIGGNINQVITVTPAWIGSKAPPSILLDFGKEIAGRVMIDPLTTGTVLVARGESADEAEYGPWHGTTTLNLLPGISSSTDYSAFRYVALTFPPEANPAHSPVKFRIFVDHKYYPVKYLGSFDCSDPLLTKIWYTGAYTCHLCMQEDIWDAPKRDRARWVGDLHVSGEVINNVFADKFLMEQTLNRLRDDAGNGDVNGIPGYSCAWVCCLADFHRHIADYKFLNAQHDRLIATIEHLRGDLDDRSIVTKSQGSWMYSDWSPGFNGDTPLSRATTDLFLIRAVKEAVFLFHEMGDSASASKYSAWANQLTASARQYLPDAASNTYSNRLQENAMAIFAGVATPAQEATMYNTVLDPKSESWNRDGKLLGDKPVMSPYYGNYILLAMSMAGHTSGALQIIRSFWGGMIAEGATTFWEAYDPNWPKADFHKYLQADDGEGYFVSLCHGWSAGPTSFLTERVLGIRPTGAGYKTAVIDPDLAGLAWAEGGVPTPRGILHVRVQDKSGKSVVTVNLPAGVNAEVTVGNGLTTVNGLKAHTARAADGKSFIKLSKPATYVIVTKT
jgi:alpha-L-rhamnosidase